MVAAAGFTVTRKERVMMLLLSPLSLTVTVMMEVPEAPATGVKLSTPVLKVFV